MANTTYSEIYKEFITNCATDDINLPNTDEKRYIAIQSAIRYFNNRTGLNIKCDNTTETIDKELEDSELLLVTNYLRLAFLKNQLTHITTIFQPFQKEIGIKSYQNTCNSFKAQIEEQKYTIDEIYALYFDDDYM